MSLTIILPAVAGFKSIWAKKQHSKARFRKIFLLVVNRMVRWGTTDGRSDWGRAGRIERDRPWAGKLLQRSDPDKIIIVLKYESESEFPQSCPTLWDPMDCSQPGSSIQGILQARILEWVAISFSRGSSRPRDQTQVSCIVGRRFTI